MGVPVVIAENGRGLPVVAVEDRAPPAVVAENGRGTPIVLVEQGGTPMVVQGAEPPQSAVARILGADGLDYAFYDSTHMETLFQNAAGTTPVDALGQPVGRWNAFQMPPHTATQSAGGARGSIQADGVKLDGVDDSLLTDWLAQAESNCIIAQVTVLPTLANIQTMVGAETSSNRMRMQVITSGAFQAAVGSVFFGVPSAGDVRGSDFICGVSCDGSVMRAFANGDMAERAQEENLPDTSRAFMIGSAHGSTQFNFWGGTIKRIAFGHVALTLDDYLEIRNEWMNA